jgi:hypothetical protein
VDGREEHAAREVCRSEPSHPLPARP